MASRGSVLEAGIEREPKLSKCLDRYQSDPIRSIPIQIIGSKVDEIRRENSGMVIDHAGSCGSLIASTVS